MREYVVEPRIVVGMGAGQCGLNLLAEILAKQPRARVTLEQPPLLPWKRRDDRPGILERFRRWARMDAALVGDVAAFYLPYVEDAITGHSTAKMICLKRPKDEIIAGFSRQLDAMQPAPMDHWSERPAGFRQDPLWTLTFPQYETSDRTEAIGRYWDEYYQRADDLARRFPTRFRIIDTDMLTSESGVRDMLDFVGVPRAEQVVMIGQRPKQPPTMPETPSAGDRRHPMDPRRCVILVPFTGFIHPECDSALKELERRGYQVRRVGGFAAIDQGRNQMSTDALVHGFDETMWIDSDVGFHPDDVEKLRAHNLPIVCGIYPQKGKKALACHVMFGTPRLTFGQQGGLVEILYAGTGFLLIRREVYLTIQRKLALPLCNERFNHPMIPFFHPMIRPIDDGHWYLAEDYAFCERARQSGFQIFADTTIRLWHVGTYRYGWEDAGMDRPRFSTFTLNFNEFEPPPPSSKDVPAHGSPSAPSSEAQISGFAMTYPWPAQRPDSEPPTNAPRVDGNALRALDDTAPRDARLIVEVGSGLGAATRHLADLASQARVVAIDDWSDSPPSGDASQGSIPLDAFLVSSWDYRDRIIPVKADPLDGIRRVANAGLQPDLVYFADRITSPEAIGAAIDLFPAARIVGTAADVPRTSLALQQVAESRRRRVEFAGASWRIARGTT